MQKGKQQSYAKNQEKICIQNIPPRKTDKKENYDLALRISGMFRLLCLFLNESGKFKWALFKLSECKGFSQKGVMLLLYGAESEANMSSISYITLLR